MERYVLYIRKSSESEERQVMSLSAQESEMLKIAKRDGLEVVEIVRESYSAKVAGKRTEFNRMIAGIKSGAYNAILTWAPDRLSRNAGDLGLLVDLMDSEKLKSIRTFSQTFGNDPNSKFMLMMLGSHAKLENDQKGENVKRGNREKLKRGDWINQAPFGYLNDKGTKTIATDPVHAPFVQQCFELYATGLYSFKQIADHLYEQGFRTKSGNKIYRGSVQRIINRTFYYGVMESNGEYYSGNHEPLISKQLFDRCQEVSENKSRPRAKTKGFTLSGFMKCEKCNCAITAEIKKGKYIYYHCTNGKGICDQRSFYTNEKLLHTQITQELEKLKINPRVVDLVYRAKLEELEQNIAIDDGRLKIIETELEKLKTQKSRLVDTYTIGDIEEELYRTKLRELKNKEAGFRVQLENIEQNNQDPRATIELIYSKFKRGYTMAERYCEGSPEERRIILSEALSNSTLLNREIVNLQYKSPYSFFAKTPVNVSFCELLPD